MHGQMDIEKLILSELKGLCSNCAYAPVCVYFKTATRPVIQCEMFEQGAPKAAAGLCKTCDNAMTCKLPARAQGAWHCDEFI